MSKHMTVAVALVGLLSPAPAQTQAVVPRSAVDVVLDGVVHQAEWADALRLGQGGTELLVQTRGGVLEIALKTPPLFVASLCIARGNEVHILHSSSAAGSATYRQTGDDWALVQRFEWRLRGADGRGATPEEQRDHMRRFGWAASTVALGAPGETEFRISPRFLADGGVRLALGLLLQGSDPVVSGWPLGPETDGCTQRTTIAGPLTDRLAFLTARWVHLAMPDRDR